jgi:hypothetical protein
VVALAHCTLKRALAVTALLAGTLGVVLVFHVGLRAEVAHRAALLALHVHVPVLPAVVALDPFCVFLKSPDVCLASKHEDQDGVGIKALLHLLVAIDNSNCDLLARCTGAHQSQSCCGVAS